MKMLDLWARYKDWSTRYDGRQKDLARGVDANLVRVNRRRFSTAGRVVVLALLILIVSAALQALGQPEVLVRIFRIVGIIVCLAAWLFDYWAKAEREHLEKPDSGKPPSIYKNP